VKQLNRLQELRREIDTLNRELLGLIQARGGVVVEIAKYKRIHDLPAVDLQRENQMLERLAQDPTGPFDSKAIMDIFRALFHASRELHHQTAEETASQEKTAS
jgi:chorismate mutase